MIIGIILMMSLFIFAAINLANESNKREDIERKSGKLWFKINNDSTKTFAEKTEEFNKTSRL